MKIPVKLQELFQQSESVIAPISALIGQGSALVDCTGIDSISSELSPNKSSLFSKKSGSN
jgi:hypothetical protein